MDDIGVHGRRRALSIGAHEIVENMLDNNDGVKHALLDAHSKSQVLHLGDTVESCKIPCPQCFLPEASALSGYDLIVSIDSEYVQDCTRLNKKMKEVKANTVLSYQYSCVFVNDGDHQYVEGIIYPLEGGRLSYSAILEKILNRFEIGYRKADGLRVLNLAHYGVAEWCTYFDREKYLQYLTPVRGVPITLAPMPVKVSYRDCGHAAELKVSWRDTQLLTPNNGGLARCAEVTKHKKLSLTKEQITDMRSLLRDDKPLFEAYAINDSRVALEYYLLVMKKLEEVTGLTCEPLTLGDAAVRAFLHHLNEIGTDPNSILGFEKTLVKNKFGRLSKSKTKTKTRAFSDALASQAFLGGLNVAFENRYNPKTPGYIFLDIDISRAYPSALAALPAINWEIPARGAHAESHLHTDLKGQSYIPISLFQIEFEFPEGSKHSCLPVASAYGLLYPRKGMTVCTGPEVALALQQNAKITILESKQFTPQFNQDNSEVQLAFAGFLAKLTQAREKYGKETLENMLLKELANSFYGKLAQGLEDRVVRDLSGGKDKLKPSKVTCGHYAALCTGLIRAALAGLIITADKFPGVSVLSATTDGAMLRIPYSGEIKLNKAGAPIPPDLSEVHPELFQALNQLYPVQALKAGRVNMGLDPDGWLESKHVGDEALTVKTRGYLLRYNGISTFLAKCGHQINDADRLEELYLNPDLETLEVRSLTSFVDIALGKQIDLVCIYTQRRVNTDFDHKRILQEDGSTKIAETVDDILQNRVIVDSVRRGGQRATPLAIALKKQGIQQSGGSEKAIRRYVLRAVSHGLGGWRPIGSTDVAVASALGVSITDFKNAKRAKFKALPNTDSLLLEALMVDIATKLNLKLTPSMRRVLTQQ